MEKHYQTTSLVKENEQWLQNLHAIRLIQKDLKLTIDHLRQFYHHFLKDKQMAVESALILDQLDKGYQALQSELLEVDDILDLAGDIDGMINDASDSELIMWLMDLKEALLDKWSLQQQAEVFALQQAKQRDYQRKLQNSSSDRQKTLQEQVERIQETCDAAKDSLEQFNASIEPLPKSADKLAVYTAIEKMKISLANLRPMFSALFNLYSAIPNKHVEGQSLVNGIDKQNLTISLSSARLEENDPVLNAVFQGTNRLKEQIQNEAKQQDMLVLKPSFKIK